MTAVDTGQRPLGRGKLRVLDLFSGIGGFSLGLERTGGFETVAFCEIDPFCRRVLAKHWPEVPCYDDVQALTGGRLQADGIAVDAICGGFPCQDISVAGRGQGIDGPRSGLWREYARLIGELRPALVLVENVPALRIRGADRVLDDLEALSYAAEAFVVGAVHAGAPHRRGRAWIVAYADTSNQHGRARALQVGWCGLPGCSSQVGDHGRAQWAAEPGMGRVVHGISGRMDRLGSLGNAIVPQVAEAIGKAVLSSLEHDALGFDPSPDASAHREAGER